MSRALELLAPARDLATGVAAIDCGADAVYIGATHHGARAAAGNSIGDIAALCRHAHKFGAKVYVTLNTLVYDDELETVRRLVIELYGAGVDALIVQDMAVLDMDIPPIDLHASTQCDIRTPAKALFLSRAGMSQLVLPREFTLDEISRVHSQVPDVTLEAFVHGALCVCYSGDCRASLANGTRSANRGECAQICRLPYTLTDAGGNVLLKDRYLLSLKDMNRIDSLDAMARAGISSFKIEGRLKSQSYVRNVVTAYSRALDQVVKASEGQFSRASYGTVTTALSPDVTRAFNRGFTHYFLDGAQPSPGSLASMSTPKAIGAPIGTVASVKGRVIILDTAVQLANGDGLAYMDTNGKLTGFRVNTVQGNRVSVRQDTMPRPGTAVYRTLDKAMDDAVLNTTSRRQVKVKALLRPVANGLSLTLADEAAHTATAFERTAPVRARTPQEQSRRSVLERLGATQYVLDELVDECGDLFVPAKVLTALRNSAVAALDHATRSTLRRTLRRPDTLPQVPKRLTFHDNVANEVARRFYRRHGAVDMAAAAEVDHAVLDGPCEVMCTRYCLRREMDRCLKTKKGALWKGPLYLKSPGKRDMRVDFDCKECRMRLTAL